MTVETETILMKLLEELKDSNRKLEAEVKETNRKLEKFIDTTNQKFDGIQKDLTDLKVGQAKLEGESKILQLINGTLVITVLGTVIKFVFFPIA